MKTKGNLKNLEKIFEFFHKVGNLKSTYRFSQSKTLNNKESVADHSWRLVLMAFVIADEFKLNINVERALKIAVIHDIIESLTGDIDSRLVYTNKITKEKKKQDELIAIEKLRKLLPKHQGEKLYNLWIEYETLSTKESKFIKALDKIETLTYITEFDHNAIDYPDMIANYADKAVEECQELKPILQLIKSKLKQQFGQGNIPWKKEYDATT